jgi:hypothetical protein
LWAAVPADAPLQRAAAAARAGLGRAAMQLRRTPAGGVGACAALARRCPVLVTHRLTRTNPRCRAQIHAANLVAQRHVRVSLCDTCFRVPAAVRGGKRGNLV